MLLFKNTIFQATTWSMDKSEVKSGNTELIVIVFYYYLH